MSIPAFKDISKKSNDVLSRDFYHLSPLSLEVSTRTPNGVSFAVEGKSSTKTAALAGKLEGRYADKGVTLTQGWLTSNQLNTKIDIRDAFTKGLDGSVDTTWLLSSGARTAKATCNYTHPHLNASVVADPFKGAFTGNFVTGVNGFLAGTEVGFDIKKGELSRLVAQLGYAAPTYSVAVAATNNFSLFTATVHHRASLQTEVGARATLDRASVGGNVGLEAAVKHALDPGAFVKAKLNNQAVGSLSYSQLLRPGVTLGVGLETNILKVNEASHKLGLSLKFAA